MEDNAIDVLDAASTASSFPCARHSPPLARTQRRELGVGAGGACQRPSVEAASNTGSTSATAPTREASNLYQVPSAASPTNSPNGYMAELTPVDSYASTTATGVRSTLSRTDTGTVSLSVSASVSASASDASSSSKILSRFAATSSSSSPSRRAAEDMDHDPSGINATVGDSFSARITASLMARLAVTVSPSRRFCSTSLDRLTSTPTTTHPPSNSSASRTFARAISANASSVCLLMILRSRRSSFSRSSSLMNRAHSSGSTPQSPVAICSLSASLCSRIRRSSRTCSRLALPPR